jgi:hypothetical protein
MAQLSDFYIYVMPRVEGCPTGLVKHSIRDAIIEFCERTRMWKYAFPVVDVVAGQDQYSFTIPDNTTLVAPTYVGVDNKQVFPTNEEDLDSTRNDWRNMSSKQPMSYYMDYDGTMYLVPTPSDDIVAGLNVEAALKPSIDSDVIPDWLFNSWAEVISHGALMRLHSMVGKVWADTQMVAMHRSKFKEGITRAKSKTMKSFAKQGKSVQPRSFGEL